MSAHTAETRAERARLDARLAADPYRFDVLVERALLAARVGDSAGLARDLRVLAQLPGELPLVAALARVAAGAVAVERQEEVCFLFAAATPVDVRARVGAATGWALARVRAELPQAGAAPLLVVEHSGGELSCVVGSLPGVAHVCVQARLADEDEARAVLVHELTHVHLSSGNRFLDEGLALYMEHRQVPRASSPVSEFLRDRAGFAAAHARHRQPLSALLSYDGRHDPYFEKLAGDDADARRVVYAQAYALVECVAERRGTAALVELVGRLAAEPSLPRHCHLVAEAAGAPLEALDDLAGSASGASEGEEPLAASALAPTLRRARTDFASFPFERTLARVRAQVARGEDVRAFSLFAVKLIARKCRNDAHARGGDVAALAREAEVLLAGCAEPGDDPDADAELCYAAGLVACLKLFLAESGIQKAIFGKRVRDCFEAALAAGSRDPDLLIDYAALELYTPVAYGGDPDRAQALLAQAEASPLHRVELEKFRRFVETSGPGRSTARQAGDA